MKLNTLKYKAGTPSTQQITVNLNSDYAVGIKLIDKNDNEMSLTTSDVHLVQGETELSATKLKNGYVTFLMATDDVENDKKYKVDIDIKGKTSEEGVVGVYKGITTSRGFNWIITKTTLSVDDFSGTTFDYNSFGNIILNNQRVGTDGYEVLSSETLSHYTARRAGGDKSLAFYNDGTYCVYFQSNTSDPDTPAGLYVSDGTAMNRVDSITVGQITINPMYLTFNQDNPTSDLSCYAPISSYYSMQTPDNKIDTDFNLIVNEQEGIGEVDGLVYDNTVKMTGTYTDGTEFSFDVPIK